MEWREFFYGLATKASPALAAQLLAWEWQGDTFHIRSKSDDTFYMEFTLPKPSDYKMTVTMAGYCKLVSYKIQLHPGDDFLKTFLQSSILSLTKKLWSVGSDEGARQLWHAFNKAFQPKTLWLEPDE